MSDDAAAPDDTDEPETALEEAFLLYRDAGLRLPPVPRELADALEEQAEWQYGTTAADLTDRAGFFAEAAAPNAPASVAFGHTGHGVASWYLCYRLLRGPLGVFVRQRFGGPFDDEAIGLAVANATTIAIAALVVAADEARAAGRIGARQRLVVVVDEVDGSGWQVLGEGGTDWQADETPVAPATAFLAVR
jgi:hypothetical protein